MEEIKVHMTKWKKSIWNIYILCDSNILQKTNYDSIVARSWVQGDRGGEKNKKTKSTEFLGQWKLPYAKLRISVITMHPISYTIQHQEYTLVLSYGLREVMGVLWNNQPIPVENDNVLYVREVYEHKKSLYLSQNVAKGAREIGICLAQGWPRFDLLSTPGVIPAQTNKRGIKVVLLYI